MKKSLIVLLLVFILQSCNNKDRINNISRNKRKIVSKDYKILTSDFELFYNKFITDSIFQLNHIKFPLNGNMYDCDTILEWKESEWKYDKFDLRKIFYNSLDSNVVKESTTKFEYQQNRLEIGTICEMTFIKVNGEWYLVYLMVNCC